MLVESYKQLRTGDAAPGTQTAYRITVRQLEALVRLSEAHARVRCDQWIQPRDVREVTWLPWCFQDLHQACSLSQCVL